MRQRQKKLRQHIFLTGFMGTGKSIVSKILSDMLRAERIDTDDAIARESGMETDEMFERFGEEYFRGEETRMLKKIAGRHPAVVSCGGGCVLRPENISVMRRCGSIILLTATPETVYERVKSGKSRPLLNGHMDVDYIAGLMEERREAYEGACDLSVSTDGKTPQRIAGEILHHL